MPRKDYIPNLRPVPGEGPSPARIMLVGERPGADEDRAGRPFVGMSGRELDRYLSGISVERDDVYVTNLVKVYADHPPTVAEIREWEGLMQIELEDVRPTVIGCIGAHSARWFGNLRPMDDAHGVPFTPRPDIFSNSRAPKAIIARNVTDCQDIGTPICLPIVHPASAFYDPEAGKYVAYDFQMLKLLLDGKLEIPSDVSPETQYNAEKWNWAMFPPLGSIAIDTEGSRKHPWCLTWSNRAGFARLVKQPKIVAQFAKELKFLFEEDPDARVLLHNSMHDIGVLAGMGVGIPDGRFVDTMVLAYLLCVEPQGLKPLSYRHAGMEMMSYTDVTDAASRSVALEYLHSLADTDWGPSAPYIKNTPQGPKIVNPNSLSRYIERILADVESGRVGVGGEPTDPRKRWGNIDPTIRLVAEESAGEMPEATLDDVNPQVAESYACRDADATWRIYPILQRRVDEMGMRLVQEIDHSIIPMVHRMQSTGMPCSRERLRELEWKCEILMSEKVRDIEAMTGWRINPDSPKQTRELLFDKLPLMPTKFTKGGKDGDGERFASTQDKVLESLRDAHPVVPLILDYREASKVRNSFARAIPRNLDSQARVHCNFRITRVSSGRLAASSPNLLAIPVRTGLGAEVRRCFIAPEGRVLASWDLNQIEMRHMAHESGDSLLCELFREGVRDVHTETASRMYHVSYNSVQKIQRYAAKRVGFGVITGITGHGLKDQMDLAGAGTWTEEECDELIEQWFKVYGSVRSYMESKRAEARRYDFVRDMWGRVRYLPGVHSPIARVREEAARQSHSHAIQAGAQGIMKVAMAAIWTRLPELWSNGWYAEPLLQIHDELVWELDDDAALHAVIGEMIVECLTTAHLAYFPNYSVPLKAEGAFAKDWSKLK